MILPDPFRLKRSWDDGADRALLRPEICGNDISNVHAHCQHVLRQGLNRDVVTLLYSVDHQTLERGGPP